MSGGFVPSKCAPNISSSFSLSYFLVHILAPKEKLPFLSTRAGGRDRGAVAGRKGRAKLFTKLLQPEHGMPFLSEVRDTEADRSGYFDTCDKLPAFVVQSRQCIVNLRTHFEIRCSVITVVVWGCSFSDRVNVNF
jgi:hypothetical protein